MKNLSRIPKIIGILIYFFVLITSFYHVFKFYEIFESVDESFVAFFVAFGFELSVLYFAYIYTKYRLKSAKHALYLSLFIVWFGNVFVMTQNLYVKTFEIAILNLAIFKFTLPILGSVFIPIGSYFIGKIMANLDMLREEEAKKNKAPQIIEAKEIIEEKEEPKPQTEAVNLNIMAAVEDTEGVDTNISASREFKEEIVTNIQTTTIPEFHLTEEPKDIQEQPEVIETMDTETKATLKQKLLELFKI